MIKKLIKIKNYYKHKKKFIQFFSHGRDNIMYALGGKEDSSKEKVTRGA